jgi:nitroreductase
MKSKVKQLLVKIYLRVRGSYKYFVEVFIPLLLHKSSILSSLYYFFSSAFRREHKGVLSGKVAYYREKQNFFMLVRNTHRLEKGLTMRPLRPIFAKHYIGETVNAFVLLSQNPPKDILGQLKWSSDVLETYFKTVTQDTQIKKLKEVFKAVKLPIELLDLEEKYIPYKRNLSQRSNISYDDFLKLTIQRRSVRWFLEKPVPREIIDKALLAAMQAPSACNRQPFEYRIFDKKELVSKGAKIPLGTVGFAENIPVFIVIVGNLNAYFSERDRHLIYVDASLANMALMLALETLGLSSCSLNWPDIKKQEKQMNKFLNLKGHQRAVMCMAVGYPDPEGKVAFSKKRSIELIRTYN